jgi:predicted nucleic acid-binding protein
MTLPLRCVLDTSVSTKQFIEDPLTPKVNQLLDYIAYPQTEIFVPDLFYIESTNTLWKYVRTGLYSATQVQTDLANLKSLCLQVVSTADLMEDAFQIAYNYRISAYDGAYVALSERVKAPLLTLDRKLVNALATSAYNLCFFADFSLSPFS